MSSPGRSGSPLAAILLVLAGCASARTPEPGLLTPGDRVRLSAPSVVVGEVRGEVLEISPAELLLSVRPDFHRVIPVDALRSLAIQRGTRRRGKEGALIGLGTGVVGFGVILASEGTDGCGSSCGAYMALSAGLLAGTGALLGTLVGLLFETEVWEEQGLPLAIQATPNGLQVEFRLPVGGRD